MRGLRMCRLGLETRTIGLRRRNRPIHRVFAGDNPCGFLLQNGCFLTAVVALRAPLL